MKTIRLLFLVIQADALWLLFSGQVDGQWFPLIVLGQLCVLSLQFAIRQRKTTSKGQRAQSRQRRKSTFDPSQPIPLRAYQAPSRYEEQPQAEYPEMIIEQKEDKAESWSKSPRRNEHQRQRSASH